MAAIRPFHLAFPVHDLDAARHFYGEVLGCAEGRSADRWIDFDFFGHQIVAHLDAERRAALFDEICAIGAQAWMTGTDQALFEQFGDRAQYFRVDNANVHTV